MSATFWPQPNGIRYPRCELPARYLGAQVMDIDAQVRKWDDPFTEVEPGPQVWQLIANRARRRWMNESRKLGPVFLEIDDDYTTWQPSYQRGRWSEQIPPKDDLITSSTTLHRKIAEESDGVIVSTPYLAGKHRAYNKNVHICQNSVDPADWPEIPPHDDGIFRIMFAGSPNLQDFRLIRRAMEWAARQDGVEVYVLGFNPKDESLKFRGVKHIDWMDDLSIARALMVNTRPDVGLRPLETTDFSRSKSDLKILEYAMCGAMSLVTPWEPYLGWRESDLVRFAYGPKDWEQEVKWCVRHQDEVRDMAKATRDVVLKTRTAEAVAPQWEEAFASIPVAV